MDTHRMLLVVALAVLAVGALIAFTERAFALGCIAVGVALVVIVLLDRGL